MSAIYLILSVVLSAFLVVFSKPSKKIVRLFLAFSGAYLLSVTILHLLPEMYIASENHKKTGILILAGVILQSVLESFSKGAEHGHIHTHKKKKDFPWLLFVGLCLHAFSEGLPIHHADDNLLWAIVIHKIPITIVLTTFLLQSKFTKKTLFLTLFFFGMMSPLGVLFGKEIAFFSHFKTEMNAIIIGIFLHISTIILFESSENHTFNFQKFSAIILGILLTIFTM